MDESINSHSIPSKFLLFALMHPKSLLAILFSLLAYSLFAQEQQQWEWLPKSHLQPVYPADGRAHRTSIQRSVSENLYEGSMGGQFPVISVQNKQKEILQLELAASTYLGLLRMVNHGSVLNTDFFVDVLLDYKFHPDWVFRAGTGHTSQHISDDAIIQGFPFGNYVRDYHQLSLSLVKPQLLVYGSFIWNYNFKTNTDLSGAVFLQTGFHFKPFKKETSNKYLSPLGIGADVKFQSQDSWNSTRSLQLDYSKQVNGKVIALKLRWVSGLDERGQFYPQNRNLIQTGLNLDF